MTKLEKAQIAYQNFTVERKSVMIGTSNADGLPNTSHAPFVMDEAKNIYIFISTLAIHTSNISVNSRVSLLLIEDESQTKQMFSRRRLYFDCHGKLFVKGTPEWEQIADMFQVRFGKIAELLRSIDDFQIYKLIPYQGQFVMGFGDEYKIKGDDLHKLIPISHSESLQLAAYEGIEAYI
jgi:putative heme iron utilization protein